jgi:hypothetical protein
MTTIRPDIVHAVRDTLSHPGLESYVARPVTLEYWPRKWGGYKPLSVERSPGVATGVVCLGAHVTLACVIIDTHPGPTLLCTVGRRSWFLTPYPPAGCIQSGRWTRERSILRVGNYHFWKA